MDKTGFNLADVLKDVPELDTFPVDDREQIEYIDIDLIDADPANFYEVSQIEALAANIETIGLQQPLRVRENPDNPYRVMIISGHRRRAAIVKLVEDGREDLRKVPCIREKTGGSSALQELRVIYANSDTRILKSAEISKQAERIEQLLYQLKEEGYEFPGRMRDHVAEVCKISKTKLARLKVIRDQLHDCWKPFYEKSVINESVAYALAQMPKEFQLVIYSGLTSKKENLKRIYESEVKNYGTKLGKVSKCKCKQEKGCQCFNIDRKNEHVMYASTYGTLHCDKCCGVCPDLGTCRHACPKFAEKIKQIKSDKKAARQQEKIAAEEAERPYIEKVRALWSRFGSARQQAGKTVKEYYKSAGIYYSGKTDDQCQIDLEQCNGKIDRYSKLPFGYNIRLQEVEKLTCIADLFGCSVDYLLCRTDQWNGSAAEVSLGWISGEVPPENPVDAVAKFRIDGKDDPMTTVARWNGTQWVFRNTRATIDAECVKWFPLPAEDKEDV